MARFGPNDFLRNLARDLAQGREFSVHPQDPDWPMWLDYAKDRIGEMAREAGYTTICHPDGRLTFKPKEPTRVSRKGPITDHVLLLPIEPPNTAHGMALPDTQAERPTQGIVVAVGPGRVTEMGVRIPPEVNDGDVVTYPSYAGVEHIMDLDGEPKIYRLVRQDEIAYNHGPADAK